MPGQGSDSKMNVDQPSGMGFDPSLSGWVRTSKPHPPNPQIEIHPECVCPGAIDKLHVNFEVDWGEKWAELRPVLAALKEQARKHKGQEAGMTELAGRACKVDPNGAQKGYAHLHYKIDVEGLTICIADRKSCAEIKSPNVKIEVNGKNCLFEGAWEAYDRGVQWLQDLGATILADAVNEVDFCVDMPNVQPEQFKERILAGCFISRARQYAEHDEVKLVEHGTLEKQGIVCQTLGFGSRRRTYVRMYDKLEETKWNDRARMAMIKNRWGYEPESATRIEFEIHRETLKVLGVPDVATLREQQGTIVRWCTEEWLRMTERNVRGKKNTDRFENCELWDRVALYFRAAFSDVQPRPAPIEPQRSDRLVKQALGCLSSECARSGIVPISPIDVANYIKEVVVKNVDTFHDQCLMKMIDLGGWQQDRVQLIKERIAASRLEGMVPDQYDGRWWTWGHGIEEMASAGQPLEAGRYPGYEQKPGSPFDEPFKSQDDPSTYDDDEWDFEAYSRRMAFEPLNRQRGGRRENRNVDRSSTRDLPAVQRLFDVDHGS